MGDGMRPDEPLHVKIVEGIRAATVDPDLGICVDVITQMEHKDRIRCAALQAAATLVGGTKTSPVPALALHDTLDVAEKFEKWLTR